MYNHKNAKAKMKLSDKLATLVKDVSDKRAKKRVRL